jgi:hypothetical protein
VDREAPHCQDMSSFQFIYSLNQIQIPENYFVDVNKQIIKIIWRVKRPRLEHSTLNEKKMFGESILPNFQTYLKAVIIKDRQVDQ